MLPRPPRRSFLAILLAAAAVSILPAQPASADSTEKLFFIQRSKNANEVHYDARVGADGGLNTKDPVDSYWLMKATDGHRESVGLLEKTAYGFGVDPAQSGTFTMKLKAFKDRPLTLAKVNGHWRAGVTIAGKSAYLTRLYIATDESGVMPKVIYVDIFGEDESGKVVQEHLVKS
jgi:hypothetical protein